MNGAEKKWICKKMDWILDRNRIRLLPPDLQRMTAVAVSRNTFLHNSDFLVSFILSHLSELILYVLSQQPSQTTINSNQPRQ